MSLEKRINQLKDWINSERGQSKPLNQNLRVHVYTAVDTNQISMIDATPMDEFYKNNGGAK